MAKRSVGRRKRNGKRHINPVRLLAILLLEFVALLGILLYLYTYHPEHPISKMLSGMISVTPEVVLDAGHGGYDCGSSYGGICEKEITLALSKEVGAALEAKGVQVTYTRERDDVDWPADEVKDLAARVQISNDSGAKLFVSIHTNASETKTGSGFEIWGHIKDENILHLAENIHKEVTSLGYSEDRGIKDVDTAPLQVLYYNKLPAVLVEAGFLESSNDRGYLLNEGRRKVMANKIADGIYQSLQELKEEE